MRGLNTVLNLNNAVFDVNENNHYRGSQVHAQALGFLDPSCANISRMTVSATKTWAWPVNTTPYSGTGREGRCTCHSIAPVFGSTIITFSATITPSAFIPLESGVGSQRRTSMYRAVASRCASSHDLRRHLRASRHTILGRQRHNARCNDVETLLRKPRASLLGEHVSHSHLERTQEIAVGAGVGVSAAPG